MVVAGSAGFVDDPFAPQLARSSAGLADGVAGVIVSAATRKSAAVANKSPTPFQADRVFCESRGPGR